MKIYVGVTDNQWFDYLRKLAARLTVATSGGSPEPLDEVNFWQPSPDSQFRANPFVDFKAGRYYYPFVGHKLHRLPTNPADHPSKDLLIWHNENMFRT